MCQDKKCFFPIPTEEERERGKNTARKKNEREREKKTKTTELHIEAKNCFLSIRRRPKQQLGGMKKMEGEREKKKKGSRCWSIKRERQAFCTATEHNQQ